MAERTENREVLPTEEKYHPSMGSFEKTYRAMKKLYEEGKIRAIGVSNFAVRDIEEARGIAVPVMKTLNGIPRLTAVWLRTPSITIFSSVPVDITIDIPFSPILITLYPVIINCVANDK